MAATDPTTALAQPGLINTAPGLASTTTGNTPTGGGAGSPVTGYTPASGTASTAATAAYDPKAFQVTPDQTVVSNIKNIIDSGSPLMQQAESRAKDLMNSRGLINSSQAITAGQSAVIGAATPIAQQDAATYGAAATNTTNAQNQALSAEAAAKNTAGLQNAQLETGTSQFNAGQTNAANAAAAGASNTVALQAQQNTANLENIKANRAVDLQITQLTNNNRTLLQTSQGAATLYNQALANLSAIIQNPNMSESQKSQALNDQVQQLNDAFSVLGNIAGIPGIASLLTFGSASGGGPVAGGATDTGSNGAVPGPDTVDLTGSGGANVPVGGTPAPVGAQSGGVINNPAPNIPGPAGRGAQAAADLAAWRAAHPGGV